MIQAILKVRRASRESQAKREAAVDHLAEAIADVRIMLAQLTMMYETEFEMDALISKWAIGKINRQRMLNAGAVGRRQADDICAA